MEIEEYAGKITARHARLIYKITNELEKRDKKLSETGHDLQSDFRKGFMLAQEIVNKTIESLPDVEQISFLSDDVIERSYEEGNEVMYSDFSRWCDGAKWARKQLLNLFNR